MTLSENWPFLRKQTTGVENIYLASIKTLTMQEYSAQNLPHFIPKWSKSSEVEAKEKSGVNSSETKSFRIDSTAGHRLSMEGGFNE